MMDEVFLFEFQNEQKIIYHSPLNDHIFELSSNLEDKPYPDSQWQTVDITKQLGPDCHTICFQSKDHQEVGIIQRGKNSNWAWKLVAFPFAPMNSGPFSIFETSEAQYITYRSILDEIQELCYDKNTDQWSHRNLSRLFNLPKAFGEPKGIAASSWQMITYPIQNALAVLYRSAYFPSPDWRYQLVQQIPPVTGDLNIYAIRDAVEVVYLNTSQKIILMEYELMPDYSLKMNLLAADSASCETTGVTGNDWTLIAYRKLADNKLGILFKSGSSQWKSIQLAEPQPKISGIPYVYSNGKEPVIIYRSDPESILYLITRNANGSFQVTNLSQVIDVPLPISSDPIGFVGNFYHTIVYKSTIQKIIDSKETISNKNLIALTKKAGFRWKQHSFTLYREPLKWVKRAVVYQVYLRCFSKEGNFKSLKENIPRLKDLGVTVLYLLPFHPVGIKSRKGALGSPYAIRDYFSIDPACGTLDDLQDLISTAHNAGLKLLYDFVPNHTSIDSKLIEDHKDWFLYNDNGKLIHPISTWIDVGQLNHKNKAVWPFMLDVLKYWSDLGFDGFRCDYVDGVPLTLWKEACNFVDNIRPMFLLAEGWDPVYYQNGFDATYSWSTHKMIAEILIDRKDKSGRLVRQLLEQEQIEGYGKGLQLRFTTTHDENAFNSRSVESLDDPRYVQIALLLTFCLPGTIPTIFNGQEIGSRKRLSLFDTAHIEWQWDDDQRQWHDFMKALIHTRTENEALIDGNARFIEAEDNLLAFYRQKVDDKILVIINLSEKISKYIIPSETTLLKILGNATQIDREITLKGYQFYIGKSAIIETEFVVPDEERKVKKSKTSELVIL